MTEQARALLRELPRRLIAAGYVDALATRGVLTVAPAVAADLDVLPAPAAALVELWCLRREVARDRAAHALSPRLLDGLLELGVVVARGDRVSAMDLVVLPVCGQLAFVPSPARLPDAYFGDEIALLVVRMAATPGAVLIAGAGPGALALHAARGARRVLAIERDPIAVACAELNRAMHDLAHVELRTAAPDAPLEPRERFDRVVVAAPTTPLPAAGDLALDPPSGELDRTGPAVLGRVLGRLPEVLEEDGVAQLAGVLHGGAAGPLVPDEVAALASTHGLRVVATVASRQPLAPGTPLFDAFSAGLAAARGLDVQHVRRAHQRYLASRGAGYLYLASITVTRSAEPGVELTRHWTRPGGSWQR